MNRPRSLRRSALVAQPAAVVFDLIEGAEHYPRFLPWCAGATILERSEDVVSADIRVAWRGLRFEMRTRNPKRRPEHMAIHLERGPFRLFEGVWRLTPLAANACKVEFALDYEFESALITRASGPLFDRITDTLVDAFVQRALSMPVAQPAPSTSAAPPTKGAEIDPAPPAQAPSGDPLPAPSAD